MAIGNGKQSTITPEGGGVVSGQLGAADPWGYLLVVIMDSEDAQGTAGRARVLDLCGIVCGPAKDAL